MALKGEIDFDDQLYMPACFRSVLDKYPLVLVDEAQDLSEIQHFLIARTVAKDGRLIAVGDPRQAIYGFRGALSDSMFALAHRFNSKELKLTQSFRCSKAAVALAQKYVPEITAFDGNKQGSVSNLGTKWKPEDIAEGSAVLCRNIAPLVTLGMACIKNNIPAYVAGRDIGAPLIKAARNLNPLMNLSDSIIEWSSTEKTKAKDNLETMERVNDITEALLSVMNSSGCQDSHALVEILKTLFAKQTGSIVLSTIHRAKGLEWDCVYFLDSWRVPQKWILKAIKNSPDSEWMLEQEHNLFYIAVTRTKDKLFFINYKEEEAHVV
jgi:superfamily I DNA/RNA helicase